MSKVLVYSLALFILAFFTCVRAGASAPYPASRLRLLPGSSTFRLADGIDVTISVATPEFLSAYSDRTEFIEHGSADRIAFTTAVPIRDFRFLYLNGAEVQFMIERELYALPRLMPGHPLVVEWFPRGSMPHRGISITDENDESRYFVFHYDASGVGAFHLNEFIPP